MSEVSGFEFLEEEITDEDLAEQLSPELVLAPGQPDPRYTRLSYSGLLDLHACPRLFQLNKLRAAQTHDDSTQITFAYGHAVGTGIQTLMISRDLDAALFEMFLNWKPDFLALNEKQKKSLAHAVDAICQYAAMLDAGFLEDYEVAVYQGKPAAELSFSLDLGDDFKLRGFLDLVLRHSFTNQASVLEVKTNSSNFVNPAQYKNSSQAIGYSVILDQIELGISDYNVEYLVQMTKLSRYESFSFAKTYEQRALWLRDVIDDKQTIQKYIETEGNYGIWPMRGESCVRFNRPCAHLDMCQLPTERLMITARETHLKDLSRDTGKEVEYQFELTLAQLLEKSSEAP